MNKCKGEVESTGQKICTVPAGSVLERLVILFLYHLKLLFRIGVGIWGSIIFSIMGAFFYFIGLERLSDRCFNMVELCEDFIG